MRSGSRWEIKVTRTLDRLRPHGQVFGVHELGAVFEQDGCLFNNQGDCVYEPDDAPKAATPKPPAEPGDPPAEPEADRRAKLEKLHASAIRKLVEESNMTPAKGAGSKARNIEQLLASD